MYVQNDRRWLEEIRGKDRGMERGREGERKRDREGGRDTAPAERNEFNIYTGVYVDVEAIYRYIYMYICTWYVCRC